MISIDDCIALCGLDRTQIAAIAEHEHIPEVAAAALANYLLHHEGGEAEIRQMITDDLQAALESGRMQQASELFMALRAFVEEHQARG
ncbi:MAG: hypothetical protein JOZ55_01680 [Alphaproteobacteria bacterium]|nr:hypothetical protein [Alphaproteobacteria bacterium]